MPGRVAGDCHDLAIWNVQIAPEARMANQGLGRLPERLCREALSSQTRQAFLQYSALRVGRQGPPALQGSQFVYRSSKYSQPAILARRHGSIRQMLLPLAQQ
jgi:hypothetical protein